MRTWLQSLFVCLLSLTCFASAHADVIFSNLGPGGSFDHFGLYPIQGVLYPPGNPDGFSTVYAARFTVPNPGFTFDKVTLPLQMNEFSPLPLLFIHIHADAGGLPGAVLDTEQAFGIPTLDPALITISGDHSPLYAGSTYWIAVSAPAEDLGYWYANDQGYKGVAGFYNDGGGWFFDGNSQQGAFQLEGAAAPESSGMALLVCGLLGIWILKGRPFLRRKARRELRDCESATITGQPNAPLGLGGIRHA